MRFITWLHDILGKLVAPNEFFDGKELNRGYSLGYMCGVDFQHELGMASGGNGIYASPEDCGKHCRCTSECGIVEVKIYFSKWIKEQNLFEENNDEVV